MVICGTDADGDVFWCVTGSGCATEVAEVVARAPLAGEVPPGLSVVELAWS